MFQKTVLGILMIATFVTSSIAYAGKVELTTYYPAPYGEYENLTSNRLTLGVGDGATAATPTGILTFVGQAGDPDDDTFPADSTILPGSLYYNTTAGQLKFKNASGWQNCGGLQVVASGKIDGNATTDIGSKNDFTLLTIVTGFHHATCFPLGANVKCYDRVDNNPVLLDVTLTTTFRGISEPGGSLQLTQYALSATNTILVRTTDIEGEGYFIKLK